MLNKYPLWKNLLLIAMVILAAIYAAPNLYGDDPALQISATGMASLTQTQEQQAKEALKKAKLGYKTIEIDHNQLLIRFYDTDTQLQAKDIVKTTLGENYVVALNLVPATPHWLTVIGAKPMKLGLDLRGGIHFSLDVDINSALNQRASGTVRNIATELREANIRYLDIQSQSNNQLQLSLPDPASLDKAARLIQRRFGEMTLQRRTDQGRYQLLLQRNTQALLDLRQQLVEQTMTTLRNRVNELGIAEAIVQQQGGNRISVDLPGIQDSARAREILGGTATIELRMVDSEHDPINAAHGALSVDSSLYEYDTHPILLKNQVILTGSSITDANSGFDDAGRASVNIRLGGGGEALFHRVTAENVKQSMAIVYVESKPKIKQVNDKPVRTYQKIERIISVAVINEALGNSFQITGLRDPNEARNLALLLRAGSLPAAIDIVEERTLGPKLGMENINKGILSIEIGLGLLVIFMACYYRAFGLIANIGLLVNLLLLVALLSLMGMTLTLSGIAGIVLTLGMAVDANVLIFERIREELRHGVSPQGGIHAGYERAFATIVDANVTTLIVALVLFGIGTGAVKGFAVTLSLGLLTSMLTAVAVTRALVNVIYGGRAVKRLSIGI